MLCTMGKAEAKAKKIKIMFAVCVCLGVRGESWDGSESVYV